MFESSNLFIHYRENQSAPHTPILAPKVKVWTISYPGFSLGYVFVVGFSLCWKVFRAQKSR